MAQTGRRLDTKDHQILALLAGDARLTNKELARQVGLAPSSCLARVRRLERHGFILGYRAIVTRLGSGFHLEGWADIRFGNLTPDLNLQFTQLVRSTPEIIEAHRISGRFDYVLRVWAGDLGAWNALRDKLEALGCTDTRLNIALEVVK